MKVPLHHVAIIVDGNRRWAKKHGLKLIRGHEKAAFVTIEPLVYHCLELHIPYLTFWCWSTENWKRGKKFSTMFFNVIRKGLQKSLEKYIKDGIKINTIGDLTKLPKDLREAIKDWQEKTKNNKKIIMTLALNYGGRDEIMRAIKRVVKNSRLPLRLGGFDGQTKLTEKEFSQCLDTAEMPDPDLIIRTGGSQRLSGFMLWQSEYSEFYFTKTLFPDFTPIELDKALKDFASRKRNFGK